LYDHFSAANLHKIIELWANSLKKITFPLAENLRFLKGETAIRAPHFTLLQTRNIFTENRVFFFGFPKAAVLQRKRAAFTLQNLRFRNAKQ